MRTYQDLRKAYLTQANIAREAYFIWENSGRPEGKSEEQWFAAIEKLEMAAEMDADHLDRFSDMGRQIIADGTA